MPVMRPTSVSVCPTPATEPPGVSIHQVAIATARPSQKTTTRTTRPTDGLITGPADVCNRINGRDLVYVLLRAGDDPSSWARRRGRLAGSPLQPSSQPSGAETRVISNRACGCTWTLFLLTFAPDSQGSTTLAVAYRSWPERQRASTY